MRHNKTHGNNHRSKANDHRTRSRMETYPREHTGISRAAGFRGRRGKPRELPQFELSANYALSLVRYLQQTLSSTEAKCAGLLVMSMAQVAITTAQNIESKTSRPNRLRKPQSNNTKTSDAKSYALHNTTRVNTTRPTNRTVTTVATATRQSLPLNTTTTSFAMLNKRSAPPKAASHHHPHIIAKKAYSKDICSEDGFTDLSAKECAALHVEMKDLQNKIKKQPDVFGQTINLIRFDFNETADDAGVANKRNIAGASSHQHKRSLPLGQMLTPVIYSGNFPRSPYMCAKSFNSILTSHVDDINAATTLPIHEVTTTGNVTSNALITPTDVTQYTSSFPTPKIECDLVSSRCLATFVNDPGGDPTQSQVQVHQFRLNGTTVKTDVAKFSVGDIRDKFVTQAIFGHADSWIIFHLDEDATGNTVVVQGLQIPFTASTSAGARTFYTSTVSGNSYELHTMRSRDFNRIYLFTTQTTLSPLVCHLFTFNPDGSPVSSPVTKIIDSNVNYATVYSLSLPDGKIFIVAEEFKGANNYGLTTWIVDSNCNQLSPPLKREVETNTVVPGEPHAVASNEIYLGYSNGNFSPRQGGYTVLSNSDLSTITPFQVLGISGKATNFRGLVSTLDGIVYMANEDQPPSQVKIDGVQAQQPWNNTGLNVTLTYNEQRPNIILPGKVAWSSAGVSEIYAQIQCYKGVIINGTQSVQTGVLRVSHQTPVHPDVYCKLDVDGAVLENMGKYFNLRQAQQTGVTVTINSYNFPQNNPGIRCSDGSITPVEVTITAVADHVFYQLQLSTFLTKYGVIDCGWRSDPSLSEALQDPFYHAQVNWDQVRESLKTFKVSYDGPSPTTQANAQGMLFVSCDLLFTDLGNKRSLPTQVSPAQSNNAPALRTSYFLRSVLPLMSTVSVTGLLITSLLCVRKKHMRQISHQGNFVRAVYAALYKIYSERFSASGVDDDVMDAENYLMLAANKIYKRSISKVPKEHLDELHEQFKTKSSAYKHMEKSRKKEFLEQEYKAEIFSNRLYCNLNNKNHLHHEFLTKLDAMLSTMYQYAKYKLAKIHISNDDIEVATLSLKNTHTYGSLMIYIAEQLAESQNLEQLINPHKRGRYCGQFSWMRPKFTPETMTLVDDWLNHAVNPTESQSEEMVPLSITSSSLNASSS